MTWQEIREKYPHRWVLVEAFGAYTENGIRVLPKLVVMGEFSDSQSAWKHYGCIKELAHDRELYPVHTDTEALNIKVKTRL